LPHGKLLPDLYSDFGDSDQMQDQSGKVLRMSVRSEASQGPARSGADNRSKGNWENITPSQHSSPEVSGASLGIPEDELTPSVRKALILLLCETERLRGQVKTSNARLDDATKYADQDALLPILNRRAFVREVTRFIAFSERYGTSSCLVYIDLDGFKAVNEIHGHVAGDAVLRHFSGIILEQIRDTDIFARVGGDEFGIILAHATLNQAIRKGKKFVRALKDQPPCWNDHPVTLKFSHGVCKLQAGETADATIAQADKAMYAQKRNARGRDRQQTLRDNIGQNRIFNL
jgi:diguanylate cyclase (GGDEF)-like protein